MRSFPTHPAPYLTPYSPFYDKVTIDFPGSPKPLVIKAQGAATKKYVKSLRVNGRNVKTPVIKHEDIANGGEIIFDMSDKAEEAFASETLILSNTVRTFSPAF